MVEIAQFSYVSVFISSWTNIMTDDGPDRDIDRYTDK